MRDPVALLLLGLGACTTTTPPTGLGPTTSVESLEFPLSVGFGCLDQDPADVDPDVPGPQYDCSVLAISEDGRQLVLPECTTPQMPMDSVNKPCWFIQPDPEQCFMASQLAISIDRGGPLNANKITVQCVTQ